MKLEHFVGIDISKTSFDVALCRNEKPDSFVYSKFSNTKAGCKQLIHWLRKEKVNFSESFFVMEHTGWYTLEVSCFLQEKKLSFSLFSPLHLKRSLGLARGKNDRVDARRLAYYGFLHRHELKSMQFPSSCLLKLKNLFAFRERPSQMKAYLYN